MVMATPRPIISILTAIKVGRDMDTGILTTVVGRFTREELTIPVAAGSRGEVIFPTAGVTPAAGGLPTGGVTLTVRFILAIAEQGISRGASL